MEWLISAMYGSGLGGLLTAPVYLVLASVSYGYYAVKASYGLASVISVQHYDTPVDGTIEEDKKVYTWANYIDFPLRKFILYDWLAILGAFNMVFPITNLWTMPTLGLAAFYNERY